MIKTHILYTVRRPELEVWSQLVFKTLRVGFPTAEITVWLNNILDGGVRERAEKAADAVGAGTRGFYGRGGHPAWIKWLLDHQTGSHEPFWICDTDMIFYDSVESYNARLFAFGGARIPQFRDEFTKTITEPRLHTSLMWIDPQKLSDELDDFTDRYHFNPFMSQPDLISPMTWPWDKDLHFLDTMGGVYHAINGEAFQEIMLERYFHLHFGTFPDLVLSSMTNGDALRVAREAVLTDPERGRGQWRHQLAYFQGRAV